MKGIAAAIIKRPGENTENIRGAPMRPVGINVLESAISVMVGRGGGGGGEAG